MGLRDAFTLFTAPSVAAGTLTPSRRRVSSLWSGSNNLAQVALADVAGIQAPFATRADALRVPAVAKAHALILTLARFPLAKYKGQTRLDADAWMYRTSTAQSPQQRMALTLGDLLFDGASLWAVDRGAKGQIIDAVRVLPDEWDIDDDYRITVRGDVVARDAVVLIEGWQPGLLQIAAANIHAAISMRHAWADRVEHPIPLVEVHHTDANDPLEEHEIADLIEKFEAARKAGGTTYTPQQVELRVHGQAVADLFIQGRNAERLDFANFVNLPASLLDGSTATASLTYSTKEGGRAEFVDYSLRGWAAPIEARLSLDDVVPAGTRVEFDLAWLAPKTTPEQGPIHED